MSQASIPQIKGYEIREMLGQGGFGAVYRAHQAVVDREVAVKVILPQYANDPGFIRTFDAEAQTIARLEHPFIIPLFDYWREPDSAYLVMRFLRGGSLTSRLKSGDIGIDEALNYFDDITSALSFAHRHGVVHRDLKPDNILLDEEGNAYLSDFGIARRIGRDPTTDDVSGTIAYMSPDQLQNLAPTPQSDIYSIGIMLYEVLSGRYPFEDAQTWQLINIHLNDPLPDITEDILDVPDDVNDVLQKATEKNPDRRYADARELMKDLRRAFKPEAVQVLDTWDDHAEIINPYKGLRAFQESDAADFFGREALVDQLLSRMIEDHPYQRFLAVVGPSGSGKSSAVRAGLVPRIRAGGMEGSESWFVVDFVPGTDPLRQLEAALLSVALKPPSRLYEMLQADIGGLTWAADRVLADVEGDLLLVIDQFEEVFTMVDDEATRTHFLDLIRTATTDPDSRLRVIITLRADFTDRPLEYANFGELMRSRTEFVLPLSPEEIERAITGPAVRVGIQVDTDLIAAIIADVSEEPGALPLLQYALTEVFSRRTGRRLSLVAYQETGGVLGALARRAEEVFITLNEEQQRAARQLLLRMVTLGEGTEDTRRRASRTELAQVAQDPEMLDSVLNAFGQPRLLSFDVDPGTRVPMIEVAHEALIREWLRLRSWLDNSRADVRLQRVLAGEVAEWEKANKDPSFLLSGARLSQYEEWFEHTDLVLTQSEQAYLNASVAERARLEAAEEERKRREEAIAERAATYETRAQQLRRASVVLGVVIVLAIIAAIGLSIRVVSTQNQVSEGQTQIAGVEPTLAGANTAIAGVEPTLAAANAQIEEANTQIADADALVDAAQAQIATATMQIVTANAQIAQANLQVAAGETQVAAFAPTVEAANTQIAGVQPTLSSANQQIAVANTQVALADTRIESANTEVAAANTQVAGVEPTISAANAQIAQANLQVAAGETQVAAFAPTIEAANTQIAGVQPTLSSANQQIAEANTQVAAADTRIESANTEVAAANTQIAGVEPTLSAANAQIEQANLQVAAGETQVAGFAPTVEAANTQIAGVAPTLAAADLQIVAANTQIAGVEPTLAAADLQILAANTQVAAGETQVAGVVPTVDAANTQIAGVQPTLVAANNQIDAAGTQVSAGETQIAGVEPTLNSANTQIAGVVPTLEAVQSEVESQREIADALRLVRSADQLLEAGNPDLAIALVLHAYQLNSQLGEVQRILNDAAPLTVRLNLAGGRGTPLFTVDSRWLVAATVRGVQVWDLPTRGLLRTLPVNDATTLALSPDGLQVVIGTASGQLLVYDVTTGLERFTFRDHSGSITDLDYHPTERRVVSGDSRGNAFVWDVERGVRISELPEPHNGPVERVTFNENGSAAYSYDFGFDDGTVSRPARIGVFNFGQAGAFRNPPEYRGFSPNGRIAYTGGDGSNFLKFFDADSTVEQRTFRLGNANTDFIDTIAWSDDGRYILVEAESRNYSSDRLSYRVTGRYIGYWEIATGGEIRRFDVGIDDPRAWDVHSLAFSPDGRFALVGGRFNSINAVTLWDVASGQIIRRYSGHEAIINYVAFSDDGQYGVSVSNDSGNFRVWDIGSGESGILSRTRISADSFDAMGISGDGARAFIAVNNRSMTTYDLTTTREIPNVNIFTGATLHVAFNPTKPQALVVAVDSMVLYDMQTLQRIFIFEDVVPQQVDAVAFSPDGSYLYYSVGRRTYRWDVQARTLFQVIESGADFIASSHNNEFVALINNMTIQVIDMVTDTVIQTFEHSGGPINSLDFSPHGDTLLTAIGEPDNTVIMWDIRTGAPRYSLIGHTAAVRIARYSPDGLLALSGADDNLLILWDLTSGQAVREYRGHTAAVIDVRFNPTLNAAHSMSTVLADGILTWEVQSTANTVNWVYANRYIREINCQERLQYGIRPQCEGGIIPTPMPTPTSEATATPTPTSTPRPTQTPSPTPLPTGVISTDGGLAVNVRAGAGAGFALVGRANSGDRVLILAEMADIGWLQIRLPDGTVGWVLQGVVRRD